MLEPDRVNVVSSKSEFIDHYEYQLDDARLQISKDDIVHFRFPNPNSLINGEPLVNGILDTVEVDKLQTSYIKSFYEKGGFMGQVWSTTGKMDKETFNRAKEQLTKKYGGSGNAFGVGIFEQGLQPVKSAYSIKDMDLSNQRKLTMQEVTSAFRIPQILLGGASDSYNRATAEAGVYAYMTSFIDPMLNYVDEVLTKNVKIDYGVKLCVKHDRLTPKVS